MGGNLFKLGRKTREEYLAIENKVRTYLDNTIGKENYRIPRYYDSKETFGDLDIIINNEFQRTDFPLKFSTDLNSTQTKKAGVVVSNCIDDFQVDIFFRNISLIDGMSKFMDYNIGNFIGKIFKRFDLKYGETGLYYVYRRENSDHYKSEYKISTNMFDILGFLGLDYEQWVKGFKTPEESYNWLIKTQYFSTYTYFKPTANNKKRIEFENFMNWLKDNNITKDWNSTSLSDEDKTGMINNYFINVNIFDFVTKEQKKERFMKIVQEKFNGKIVMDLSGFQGKSLGLFIKLFREYIEVKFDGEFTKIIYSLSKDTINNEITNLLKFYKSGDN